METNIKTQSPDRVKLPFVFDSAKMKAEYEKSVIRLTIPIIHNENVTFFLNGTPVPLQTDECWDLRLTDPHRILNQGTHERVNLSIDMIPNEWIRKVISDSQSADK